MDGVQDIARSASHLLEGLPEEGEEGHDPAEDEDEATDCDDMSETDSSDLESGQE